MRIKLPHDQQKIAELTGNEKYAKMYNMLAKQGVNACSIFLATTNKLDLLDFDRKDYTKTMFSNVGKLYKNYFETWEIYFYPLSGEIVANTPDRRQYVVSGGREGIHRPIQKRLSPR